MLNAYKSYWMNFCNFKNRTSRKSYWLNVLATFIVSFIIGFVVALIFNDNVDYSSVKTMDDLLEIMKKPSVIIDMVWTLINFIPMLAIDIRRLHDTNKSGWFIFINLIPIVGSIIYLVFMCSKSVDENNKYGKQV